MKFNLKEVIMKVLMVLLLSMLIIGCDNSNDEITEIEGVLSKQEIEDLQFLKEEEKLARDVYLFAFDLYGQNIFKNISNSEQSHMNSVKVILEKYDVEDLSLSERGKFTNQILQNLYDDLTSLASKSLEGALIAGATIEDLDINDLENFILDTNYDDINAMYALLICGSRNHLRAYINKLDFLGEDYTPQFISEDEFLAIVNSSKEICSN